MQVILQPHPSSEGGSVEIETNSKAILSSLISSYCAQKGIKFDNKFTIYDEKKRPLPMYSTLSDLGIENRQTLLVGKEDSSFTILKQWPIIVALATIAIGFIGILTMSLVYGLKGGEYFDDYGVVIDAGSSKTNAIAYKWRSNKFRGTGRVSEEDSCYEKGGIAGMNPLHLETVIDCAKNVTLVIEPASLTKTPLFFAATAGMRLLNLTNASRVNEIMKQLKLQLPDTGLHVKNIEIITGRKESLYGWITTNFLLKALETPEQLNPWKPTTYGALDMGGASMQMSYALPKKEDESNVINIKLYGQSYQVFAQSNLCFGRDEAHNRYRTLLMDKRNGTVIKDPCAPKGYQETLTHAKLFESICTKRENADSLEVKKLNFTYMGTSEPEACHKSVSKLLDEDFCKSLKIKECFKKHRLPNDQKFLAFATFFYTANFLEVKNVTLEKYEEVMRNFCLKDYDEVKKLTNESFGPEYCFNAQYIYEVLINGLGLNNETWRNVEIVKEIDGKSLGWTLGYMISATNIIPEKTTPRLISATALTVSLILFILLIICTAIFLLFTCRSKSNSTSES